MFFCTQHEESLMSHATEVRDVPDSMIREYPPREVSGYIDYAIGRVSVSWRGGVAYLCGTCQGIDRFQNADHPRGCAHIKRIIRYREEHSPDSAA